MLIHEYSLEPRRKHWFIQPAIESKSATIDAIRRSIECNLIYVQMHITKWILSTKNRNACKSSMDLCESASKKGIFFFLQKSVKRNEMTDSKIKFLFSLLLFLHRFWVTAKLIITNYHVANHKLIVWRMRKTLTFQVVCIYYRTHWLQRNVSWAACG